MRAQILAILLAGSLLGVSPTNADKGPSGGSPQQLVAFGLSSPAAVKDALFEWANAPGWIFKDVVFGVRQGSLVFAQFTAIPPGGLPVFHDKSAEVDYLIEDSKNLPEYVSVDVGNGKEVLVKSFTIGVLANGRAVIDSAHGLDSKGMDFHLSTQAGSCGAPFVLGQCTDICSGVCQPSVSTGDPCVCFATGGCLTGNARFVCPVGSCTTACAFQAPVGCMCLQ